MFKIRNSIYKQLKYVNFKNRTTDFQAIIILIIFSKVALPQNASTILKVDSEIIRFFINVVRQERTIINEEL